MNIKLNILRFLKSLAVFAIFLFCYNNIEAKDIEIHSKTDNSDIVFYMKTGAYTQNTTPWTYYRKDATPVKEYGDDIMANISSGRLRSYSYIIHNRPFSKYVPTDNSSAYGYVTSFDSNGKTKYTNISPKTSEESVGDNYIEFARLSTKYKRESYTDYAGTTRYVDVQCNVIPKVYLNKIRENKNELKSGIVGTEYMFYISEPIAARDSNGNKYYVTRKVFENDEKWHDRNVGYLCASTITENNILSNFSQYR